MSVAHALLAILVMIIWGINFIFVKLGLDEVSPLLLCSLRFFFASIPAVFFIKPPAMPFRFTAAYGFFMFALQFSLVFTGMNIGMTPGMASLILQVQVFFSMLFAALILGEKPRGGQVLGALISFSGIVLVAFHFDQDISVAGFFCMLAASASWGVGNLVTKKISSRNLLPVVVWGSFIACIPMLLLALIVEGPYSFIDTYQHVTSKSYIALFYIVYISTWIGYGLWGWLLSHYPVATVVPFSLLVPVVGILSSVLIFGEPFQLWKVSACLLVISGLCINLLSTRFYNRALA